MKTVTNLKEILIREVLKKVQHNYKNFRKKEELLHQKKATTRRYIKERTVEVEERFETK